MASEALKKTFESKLHPMFASIDDEMVLHPEAIAEMLGMSNESVRRWCRSGKLANYNFGNKYIIMGSDFKEFMRKHKKTTGFERLIYE